MRTCCIHRALLGLGPPREGVRVLPLRQHSAHGQHIWQVWEAQLVCAGRLHRRSYLHPPPRLGKHGKAFAGYYHSY